MRKHLNVAIVTGWITGTGGSERVLYQLHKSFPDAPIYTATYETDKNTLFGTTTIKTSWMQKLPRTLRKHQLLTLPRQWYFGRLKLKGYDVVISAGSSEEKAVRAPDGIHINMCYTPTLYYWVKPENYLQKNRTGSINPLWRLGLKMIMPLAKKWDLRASKRPDFIYGISTEVQKRIKSIYNRDSSLLYPPVDIERFANDGTQKRNGFVIFGRHVQHKRIDLAIGACNELGADLIVIGDGPETPYLKSIAGSTIKFVGRVDDDKMINYLSKAEAFIFPNEEDFGIVSLEAQAAGIPVIAYRAGGAIDTVVEGVTGEFFDKQTIVSLTNKLRDFNYKIYNRQEIIKNAERFSNEKFAENVNNIVQNVVKN